MSAALPPFSLAEKGKSPTLWWCGTEDGEITLGALATSETLWRLCVGTEAKMNISACKKRENQRELQRERNQTRDNVVLDYLCKQSRFGAMFLICYVTLNEVIKSTSH